ncbi:hypothetical protein BOX15_Mlig034202g1 [Macrostomum lignano]|uniref:Uncharacterized protein n=1 Tax=Macrostomum lignano TaxID=282301 RepID=A0A267F7W1_9PLAT|nr:hypothetical protein BOX15_Mlig034202g1 [Macrostomum lignano]
MASPRRSGARRATVHAESRGQLLLAGRGHGDDEFDLYWRLANRPAAAAAATGGLRPAAEERVGEWVQDLQQATASAASAEAAPTAADRKQQLQLQQPQQQLCRHNRSASCRHNRRRSAFPESTASVAANAFATSSAAAAAAAASTAEAPAEESDRPRANSMSGRRLHGSVKERMGGPREGETLELPEPREQLVRVRSFKRTKHGLVNQGDEVRKARSNCSLNNSSAGGSELELRPAQQPQQQPQTAFMEVPAVAIGSGGSDSRLHQQLQQQDRRRSSSAASGGAGSVGNCGCAAEGGAAAPPVSAVPILYTLPSCSPCQSYRVQVMGAPRVGKTTMCEQFMSSENKVLDSTDDDQLDESQEKFVTVLLDSEEYHMTFLDTERADDPKSVIVMDVDAYMIVFAVDSRRSFNFAKQILNELVSEARKSAALIIVANKSDLVRSREVTRDDAKNLAGVYNAKFIEISTALNHNVDELLVSILGQIKTQQRKMEKERSKLISKEKDGRGLRASMRLRSPRTMIGNFIKKHFTSKSCEEGDHS